jgi:hypothetical protein
MTPQVFRGVPSRCDLQGSNLEMVLGFGGRVPSGLARRRNRGESAFSVIQVHWRPGATESRRASGSALPIVQGLGMREVRAGRAGFRHLEPGPGQNHSPLEVLVEADGWGKIVPPQDLQPTPTFRIGGYSSDHGLSGWRNQATWSPRAILAPNRRTEGICRPVARSQSDRRQAPRT